MPKDAPRKSIRSRARQAVRLRIRRDPTYMPRITALRRLRYDQARAAVARKDRGIAFMLYLSERQAALLLEMALSNRMTRSAILRGLIDEVEVLRQTRTGLVVPQAPTDVNPRKVKRHNRGWRSKAERLAEKQKA
jgi:hypothetical protein